MTEIYVPGVNGKVKAVKWPRIIVGIAWERAISYASDVMPWIIGIVQRGHPIVHYPYTRIDIACNKFASMLLESPATHLVILGLDHIHPTDIVEKFTRRLQEDPTRQVVAGLNFRRGEPYDPLAWVYHDGESYTVDDPDEPGILRVDAVGNGTICIAREVFETIPPPWFWFDYQAGDWEIGGMSEDMVFCRSCQEHGIDIWLDTSIVSDHLTVSRVNAETHRDYVKQHPDLYGDLMEV